MIKIGWALGGLLGLAAMLPSEEATPFPSIESKCQLIWKTKTGDASFRSNVVFRGDRLWIGSNGDSFMDRGLIEPGSGVYELDRRTGKQRRHFANELFGDMDVNGLLMRSDRLYFGNDNEEFLCTDLQGKILWRNPTSGDIEHEPSLLQTKNGEVVVYAAESGEVKAVDPEQGKVIWSYYVPEFDGWKPGDDRTVFKVKAWFRNTSHFYTRPLVVDVNADGTNDLIYRTFGGNLLALNGNTGSKLWSVEEKESLSLGMAVIGQGKQKKIVALRNIYADTVRYEIAFFSLQGQKLASRPVSELSWGSGLNALSIDGDRVLINGRTKTFQVDPSGSVREIDRSIPIQFKSWNNELVNGYRNGNDPLFAEGFIPLKNGKKGVVVMNQCDLGNTDVGFVEILSLEDGSVLDRFSLPACGEMPPVIRDVDLDGNLDLLFAGYDGYLYCYQLPKY
jgi:outer membrane protein assembly factor BamB